MANLPGQQVNGPLSSRVLRADLGKDFANDLCDPILRQLRGSQPRVNYKRMNVKL
jgi:hypothetical protein